MRLPRPIVLCFAAAALALPLVVWVWERSEPVASSAPPPAPAGVAAAPEPALPEATDEPATPLAPVPMPAETDSEFPEDALIPGQYGYDNDFRRDYPEGYWEDAPVEELREAIYARQIDHVDRLHLLDEFVETGDADPRELWGTGWASADDFKDEDNGFALLKGPDERFYFVPDARTMRQNTLLEPLGAYDYDQRGEVFVRKTDYYGKPMMSAVKFLKRNVLVMMIVSGDKVDLNIYEQNGR